MMAELAADLRIAIRTLLRARGFTAAAVVTLALGIALNASVLAVVNAYLLKSLPYPEATRLYSIRYAPPDQNPPRGLQALPWHSLDDVIEHPIAWDLDMFFLIGGDHPERAPGAWVTPGFMQGLGIRAVVGRVFGPDDFQSGSPQVALISHSLWHARFSGDPSIVGQRFEAYVSDRPTEPEIFTIVGVLPAGFWHVNPYTEVFVPLRATTYPYMARLREGIPLAEAERRITALVKSGVGPVPADWQASVRSVHSEYVGRLRPILVAIAAAAALVLLIACANVAFLLLIRATRREREIAVRLALGAGRIQIARMLAVEGLALGAAATAGGIALSWLALRRLAPIVQQQLGRPAPGGAPAIAVDGFVLTAALACCVVTAFTFALVPLLTSWRANLSRAMQAGSRSGAEGKGSRRTRSALIALEVAASLALLAGCGLMVRTVVHLLSVDLGYRTERVLAASVGLRERSYPDAVVRQAFYERLVRRLAQVPGVESVALTNWPAVAPPRPQPLEAEDAAGAARREAGIVGVSPGYFATLGVPRVEGRDFALSDRIGAEPVALVSETLARRLWPQGSVLGRRIRATGREAPGADPSSVAWRTVVGVVKDVRQSHTDEDRADLYVPLLQVPGRFASVYVRTAGEPLLWLSALRRALKEIDPAASLQATGTLQGLIDEQLARPRFLAGLLAAFAVFAVLLALLGMYGVIAYAVKQREHEIAVRMAVGADARDVMLLFLRQGALVLGIGIAAGLYGAAVIGRLLAAQVHGIRSNDPPTLVAASLAFACAGLAAVWWPARRAARTDPAVALREE